MIDQLSPSDLLYITDGFARGIEQDEYLDLLAAAREAPCPPGPNTPDTFRLYEALEAGCQPVVDQPTMHFLMKYGDNAPVISCRWDAIGSFGSPFELADNGARWQTWKRRLAYQLRDDIDLLSGAERFWSDTDQITVLISTSPSILHPDTAIIDETIQSIRDRLPRSEILIMCDGVRPEQQDLTDQYLEYLRRVVWKSMHHWANVYPIVMGEFVHQAEATRRTLPMVHTPLVLFVEHDTPLIGEIPFDRLAQIVTKEDMVIRLHHEARVHPEHEHLNASELIRRRDVWLQPTVQWSQRPHLARTEKYRRLLADWFTPDSPDVHRGQDARGRSSRQMGHLEGRSVPSGGGYQTVNPYGRPGRPAEIRGQVLMTDRHQERLYWDAAASDPANIGGIGMPPVEHFLNVPPTGGTPRARSSTSGAVLDVSPSRWLPCPVVLDVHAVDVSQAMLDQIPPHPHIFRPPR